MRLFFTLDTSTPDSVFPLFLPSRAEYAVCVQPILGSTLHSVSSTLPGHLGVVQAWTLFYPGIPDH
eukprot:1170912-Prorocentrum_lima.AAC.1